MTDRLSIKIMHPDPAQLVNQFITHQQVDKSALREYVDQKLTAFHKQYQYLMTKPNYQTRWHQLSDYLNSLPESEQKTKLLSGWQQINDLHEMLHGWRSDNVDTEERFEFSIQRKAHELHTGDEDFDYYTALLIRHDQLLSAVLIFQTALDCLAELLDIPQAADMARSDAFQFFVEQELDHRIFQTAEQIYHLRQQHH